MSETKEEIRKRILSLRGGLSREELYDKSTAIFGRLFSLEQYRNASVILAYMDYRNEVMTRDFIRHCLKEGKKIALPRVETESGGKELAVHLIRDLDNDTLPGYKGISEPDGTSLPPLDPEEIDLAVIPGVAFDYGGNRLGYGAGYYDRFLRKLRTDCLKAGVAFCLQVVDALPADRHDIAMDLIVTEKRLIV